MDSQHSIFCTPVVSIKCNYKKGIYVQKGQCCKIWLSTDAIEIKNEHIMFVILK